MVSASAASTPATPAPPTLSDVAFASPKTGWVTVQGQPSGALGGQILVTTDGGLSWRSQWAGAAIPTQLVVGGAGQAWVLAQTGPGCNGSPTLSTCGAEVLGTSNAGQTWNALGSIQHDGVEQIAFSKPTLGLAAGMSHCPGQDNPATGLPALCPGAVLISTNDGHSWQTSLSTAGPVIAVAQSPGTLWAVETEPGAYPATSAYGDVSVIRSQDGGQSWSTVGSLPTMLVTPGLTARLLVGAGGSLWISLFDLDDCAMQGCIATVWHSQDGGSSWTHDTPPMTIPCSDSAPASLLSQDPSGGVWDAFTVVLSGCPPPASVLEQVSVAAPATWRQVVSWPQFSPIAMSWVSPEVGYAASRTALLRTRDAGAQWTQVLPAPAPSALVDALSARVAFGAGEASSPGVVSETTDGGKSWAVRGTVPGTITGLDFASARRGYAATANEAAATWSLYLTRDGGRNWGRVGPVRYTSGPVLGPWMSRDGQGVLVGSFAATQTQAGDAAPAAFVWHTLDGGRQWTKGGAVDTGSSLAGVVAATFLPSHLERGLVLVVGGPMVERLESTSDGGLHWTTLANPLQPQGVQWAGPDELWGWSTSDAPAATPTYLWFSRDGGQNWSPRSLPKELAGSIPASGSSVSAINSQQAWLLDESNGQLWRTSDGGHGWTSAGLSALP
ncbi:MAG TPA: hypothetical protein VNH38_08610 [Candidatus Dormibacteraeota bacterium]|nr:hypothetical protein [Candidatus Dormibacteraeota bacterium]